MATYLIEGSEGLPRRLELLDLEAQRALQVRVEESWAQLSDVKIEAPPGKLGISFRVDPDGSPIVATLTPTSPLRGMVGLKWRLLSIDGTNLRKVSEPQDVTKVLLAKYNETRKMTFDAGEPKQPASWSLLAAYVLVAALCIFVGSGKARALGLFGDGGRQQALEMERELAAQMAAGSTE